jgi:hypothetical protein
MLAFSGMASAVSFTVAPGAVGGAGALCALGPADVCNSPGNATNSTYALAAVLGLGAGDVVDALSFNSGPPHPPPFNPLSPANPLQFSVAPGAVGPVVAPDPGTIYRSAGGGAAMVDITRAALGLAVGDDVDGFENRNVPLGGANAIFFSLAPGSPSLGAFSPGDIFLVVPAGGAFGLFINAESLGLCTIRSGCAQDDDLDALVVNTDAWVNVGQAWPTLQAGQGLLFSVAPGAVGQPAGLPAGTQPGDVLHSLGGGASALYAGAAALGLAAGDNLDALEIVPEPTTLVLLAAGLAGLALWGRRGRP